MAKIGLISKIKGLVLGPIGIAELVCAAVIFALAYLLLKAAGLALVLAGLGVFALLLTRLAQQVFRTKDAVSVDRAESLRAHLSLEEAIAELRRSVEERRSADTQHVRAILARQDGTIQTLQRGALQTQRDNERRATDVEKQGSLLAQQSAALQAMQDSLAQVLQEGARRTDEVNHQNTVLSQQAEVIRVLQDSSAKALIEIERQFGEVELARLACAEQDSIIEVLQDKLSLAHADIERVSAETLALQTMLTEQAGTIQEIKDEVAQLLPDIARRDAEAAQERSELALQPTCVQALASQLSQAVLNLRAMERDADIVRTGVIEAVRAGSLPARFYTAGSFNPEADLLPIIAEFVSPRIAIDVGANRGDFTAALRRSGFVVHAFEPLPTLYAALSERFSLEADQVYVYQLACSDNDGSARLHLAAADDQTIDSTLFSTLSEHPSFDGLTFDDSIEVPLRRLDTVFSGSIPIAIGLLKIDAEGHDVSVLKGASGIDAAVLMVEFWDRDYVFNAGTTRNSLGDYLKTIDQTKYPFRIVMWRGRTRDEFGIDAGASETRSGSWGNIMFLSDASLHDAVVDRARRTYGADRVGTAGDMR